MFLLTDGQDSQWHDYSQLMVRLPENTACHTFGYGLDHDFRLLALLAEKGNGGTFTYIVSDFFICLSLKKNDVYCKG